VAVTLVACGGSTGSSGDVDTVMDTTLDTGESDSTSTDTVAGDSVGTDTSGVGDTAEPADTVETADTTPVRAEWPPPTELGDSRTAPVMVPSSYDGYGAVPAVFLLGGYDYFSEDLDDWISLSARVDSAGFVLVLPDGLVDSDGSPYWNATDTCCDYDETGVDDVGWLTGLIDELESRFHISGVGLVGHSAGGFMAYRMACEVPDRLGGLVSIAGSGFLDEEDCAVTDVPLSVLQVHGEDDDIMPFSGDDEAPGIYEMLDRWALRDGCALESWNEALSSVAYATEGESEDDFFTDCPDGLDVRLWYLYGADHYPDFEPVFTDTLLGWLLPRLR